MKVEWTVSVIGGVIVALWLWRRRVKVETQAIDRFRRDDWPYTAGQGGCCSACDPEE